MAKTKQVLTREQAEEFTHNLGQITAGDYGLIDMAVNTLGVPAALGLAPEEWVEKHLGGYVQWTVEKRRDAVRDLLADGKTHGQIAQILGVSEGTVANDKSMIEAIDISERSGSMGEIEAKNPERSGSRPKTKDYEPQIRELIEEGKKDAVIAVSLGLNDPTMVKKVRTEMKKENAAAAKAELARIKAAAEAETTTAQKKEAEARLAEIGERVTGQIQAAYGFDPYVAMKDAADMVFTVSAAGGEFDVEGTIREAMRALDELWVIGAKRGLDVSAIAHLFDRMKGDV